MKLTREFIELQGFEFIEHAPPNIYVFYITNMNGKFAITWDADDYDLTVEVINEEDEDEPIDETVFENVVTVFDFIKLLIVVEKLTNKGVSFPENFVELFMSSDYNYTQEEFERMCEASMIMLLAYERYESCPEFLEYRKNYMIKKNWEYKEMAQENFKDYSRITTKCY